MATLYQNKGHWLLTVHHKGRRLTKSLGTKDKKVAKQLKPYVESELLLELTGLKKFFAPEFVVTSPLAAIISTI